MDRATLGTLVWKLSTRWRAEVDRLLTPLGLTHGQYEALRELARLARRGATPSQRALAEALSVSPIHASKLLRALEAHGLVRRAPDPADTRARQLSLTGEGTARLAEARARVTALERSLTLPLGDPDGRDAQAFRIMLRSLLSHQTRPAG